MDEGQNEANIEPETPLDNAPTLIEGEKYRVFPLPPWKIRDCRIYMVPGMSQNCPESTALFLNRDGLVSYSGEPQPASVWLHWHNSSHSYQGEG